MDNETLDLTLSALADPTRRQILAQLSVGDATVKDLAEPFSISLAAVSKHLKVLETAGLISRGREAQYRPCHLETGPLDRLAAWLDDYRRFVVANLDQLETYLDALQADDPNAPRN